MTTTGEDHLLDLPNAIETKLAVNVITDKTERLSHPFKNEKSSAKAGDKLATNKMKKNRRALDLVAESGSGVVTRIRKSALSSMIIVTKVCHAGKRFHL